MKLLTSSQIKAWDKYTIDNEPVVSIDLMERASQQFVQWFSNLFDVKNRKVVIVCGNGNNGGDGLAIARLLSKRNFQIEVFVIRFLMEDTIDFDINLSRLMLCQDVRIQFIHDSHFKFPENVILIDAILGTGINKPVKGLLLELINYINRQPWKKIISVDIPSGLPAEGLSIGQAVQADYIYTFQCPKLSFFHVENERFYKRWIVGDIGLQQDFLQNIKSDIFLVDSKMISQIYKRRTTFRHKGDFGHALIIAGSQGKMGAAILAAQACLRTGAGLVTTIVPENYEESIHITIPEAMIQNASRFFSDLETIVQEKNYTLAFGPGLGKEKIQVTRLKSTLEFYNQPMIIDADGLNIIAENQEILRKIPANSILTPHPKEFERLFGKSDNSEEMYRIQKSKSVELGLVIVLKGAYTRIAAPDGTVYINNTGNPGMATAGSGDVLTGMITGLVAQKYTSLDAAILGVYLHGLSADLALGTESEESLIASDIIKNIGKSFTTII